MSLPSGCSDDSLETEEPLCIKIERERVGEVMETFNNSFSQMARSLKLCNNRLFLLKPKQLMA